MFPGTAEVTPRATILIDLSDGLEPVLAGMTPRTRYNTKVGARKGIEVREGGEADLDIFYGMLRNTADRQGFTAFPRGYFGAMWRVLNPRGHLRLALAEVDGEPVAAQLVIAFGDTVINKMSVWSGLEGNRRPNEALQWSTLEWAVANGYRTYDLEGIKLSAAEALLRGDPLPDTLRQSVTSYKLGFGGVIAVAPPPLVHVANPALRWAFSEVYPRVMDHRRVKALVRSVRTRPVGSEAEVER